MKRFIRKIFRKKIILSLMIILLIGGSFYYLSSSKVPLKNSYENINLTQFNDQVFYDIQKNFDGNTYDYVISQNDINNYMNAYFKENINRDAVHIEAFCSTLNKKVQVNIDYFFIHTTLFFDFEIMVEDHQLVFAFDQMKLGKSKVKMPQFLVSIVSQQWIPSSINIPAFVNIHDIDFQDQMVSLSFELDHDYLESVYTEYSKVLDPDILNYDYIGEHQEVFDYIISFFSNSILTKEKINEMTLNLLWDYRYFEVMTLIKKDEKSEYNQFIQDVSLFSTTIKPDVFESQKQSYKKKLNDLLENNVLTHLNESKTELFTIINDYIYQTPSNAFSSKNGLLYLYDTREVLNVNLLSRKGYLDITLFEGWDVYCENNQVLLGYDTEIGYVLYTDLTNHTIFSSKKEALLFFDYQLLTHDYKEHNESDILKKVIADFENVHEVKLRHVNVIDHDAYVIASPQNSQIIKQYLLKFDSKWQVVADFHQTEIIRTKTIYELDDFNEQLIPRDEIASYDIDFIDDQSWIELETLLRRQEIINDFTTLTDVLKVDDLLYFKTSDNVEFIQVKTDDETIVYYELDDRSLENMTFETQMSIPFFIRILR